VSYRIATVHRVDATRRICRASLSVPSAFEQPIWLQEIAMSAQRTILAIGFAVMLAASAASIVLDIQARSDEAWVTHTLEVLYKLSNTRLVFRRAESSARGYLLTDDPTFLNEYQSVVGQIEPALQEFDTAVHDNPAQVELLRSTRPLVDRRFAVIGESIRLHAAGDTAGMTALTNEAEGRTAMEQLTGTFDQLAAAERHLLAVRCATLQRTRGLLLGIGLAGTAAILILAMILVWRAGVLSRKQDVVLRATEAQNTALEAAVSERTAHLQAALESLRQSTSVLNNTFASMAEAVLIIDQSGALLHSNEAAARMLGAVSNVNELSTSLVAQQIEFAEPLHPDARPSVRALRGERFDDLELVVRRQGLAEPITVIVSGRPLRDASGAISGAALIYHDVTMTREIERKLQQSQKLEAIGRLTGGVAHDFNNMLTVIAGTTEILTNALVDRPDIQAVATLIDRAADRCTELVAHLLAFARKQPLQPRNVDVNQTMVDIAKLLRPTLGEQVQVDVALQPDVRATHIDPSQLTNAVVNLAINARDAMPNGGKLLLETRNTALDEAYAQSNAEVRPGDYVMIAISDTGTGMSPALLEKVFEPFFTTKEAGRGSGLGLSMVYGFVKQSGGHIKVYSEEGYGTTIKLYLPPADAGTESIVPEVETAAGGQETILVVEDDTLVRNFVVAQLNSLGYETVTAKDPRAALAHVDNGRTFDLLFTDVIMPGGMTGRDLAEEVIRRRPGTKVLYTSGYTESAIVHHGKLDSGVMLLTKPYRKSALSRLVRQAIDSAAS
jgi:PAS domain S-box-containing protein